METRDKFGDILMRKSPGIMAAGLRLLPLLLLWPGIHAQTSIFRTRTPKMSSVRKLANCVKVTRNLAVNCEFNGEVPRRTTMGAMGMAAGMALRQIARADETDEFSTKIFMDISINEGDPQRVVIGVYNDASLGGSRFLSLAEGAGPGLDYRRSLFTFISPDKAFIKNAGVGSTTGLAAKEITLPGGRSARGLYQELAEQKRTHVAPGTVSLVVRSAEPPPPPTKKLVASSGRLITVEEAPKGYVEPNGSEFIITTKEGVSDLDKTNLVVGRVIEGMEVISRVSSLATSKPKGNDDPFFKIGKSIGDSRALFMSTRFGRPFARVQITACGKL